MMQLTLEMKLNEKIPALEDFKIQGLIIHKELHEDQHP
jgi:hypothetical protein